MTARRLNRASFLCLALGGMVLAGCASLPEDAFKLPPDSLENRQIQSRRFETVDEELLLSAGAGVLQDLGYSIDETNATLGVLTASKMLDAKQMAQMIGSILMAALTGTAAPTDKEQKITVCLVIKRTVNDPESSVARITLQREVWNDQGLLTRSEAINEPELYQAFFEKLSKATFLEANQI